MKVKDFMIKDVISTYPGEHLKDIMKTFVEKKIGGMPVVDDTGKLLGMITDGDILRAMKPRDLQIYDFFTFIMYVEKQELESLMKDMAEMDVLKIAKRNGIVTVSPDDGMEQAMVLLAKHHFKKLPVVDKDHKVVGVISRGDVIRNIQITMLSQL